MSQGFWQTLSDAVFSPRLDDAELEAKLKEIKQHLPTPVFWLLGKTQSGKTSLVRALTGRNDAEIGNGFKACTRWAQLYDFPSTDQCIVRFLDTRGLGEVDYDPGEDLHLFAQQSHVLIVVIKALDHAQHAVMEALRTIVRQHPEWPVIVIQTCLHEGYPSLETDHILPYPYHQLPFPVDVPSELARSLLKQRQLFWDIPAQFVPVDFTLPNDGYNPNDYGIEALWKAIERALPIGLQGMITSMHHIQLQDVYAQAAHPHILAYAVLAAGGGAIPVPFIGMPLVLSIQAKMFHTLASLYNQELNSQRFAEIGSALGVTYALGLGGRELAKLIPGYGSVISSLYSAAVTYALGKTLCVYFSEVRGGSVPNQTILTKVYQSELERGKSLLRDYIQSLGKNHS